MSLGFLKQHVQAHHRSYSLVGVPAEGQLKATEGHTTHRQYARVLIYTCLTEHIKETKPRGIDSL